MKNLLKKISPFLAALILVAYAVQSPAKGPRAPAEDSITDIVIAVNDDTGEFGVLRMLLENTGLATVLDVGGQFTVFAPTDAAFTPILGALGGLTEQQVINVLLYHVTDGRRWSNSVVNKNNPKSIEMLNLDYITSQNNGFLIDTNLIDFGVGNAKIVDPNINASNGVIHVINQVLLPSNLLD